ncbi:NADPH-dependent 2,4-dienoyl-CoA reductase/sulfur reductase-like enzyme/nitrite reductase/ring-hydroxylating ferredoxin subunit [Lewinella aquimaris]|uniref:NADPH-dependent 2,4-dienoyl-CoA reductase/sulfur reductase-like enzyme/nitrite reductase/ring-hydroxylating ferredoxin subunit n=1 Tax=Neolewinella aquimaris TaxID=1835722 RepID=A0A840E1X3_9BACT|nr:apoptosis inducing factor family protein [Neolewinella aquimaris]MBB4077705.1 NADPH-dependent 2,4-dienoyl-CoA reductase/sulfur reductase-like enzyme/nitrite reductase/ring-hydroxylating ferredoxin subunit [Neolewinella aquimaris]
MTPVFTLSQLPDGHMHQVKVGEYDVLLANVAGEVYAVENKCSHYGAPLTGGALCQHRVRCPWHHACFDVRTGAQIEAPGMDGLARFAVRVTGDDISVSNEPVEEPRPEKVPERTLPEIDTVEQVDYLVVGGGAAGAYAVEAIRGEDAEGSILFIAKEGLPPYDRTMVSKPYLEKDMPVEKLPLRSAEFYRKLNVNFLAGTQVQGLDLKAKSVTLPNGHTLSYDRVLLATGATPLKLKVPGSDLDGVYTLRKAEDAHLAREATGEGSKVVIIGGSFIGLEAAMSLGKRGGDITVVTREKILFEPSFGEKVGRFIRQLHEEAGVTFRMSGEVKEIRGEGKVREVELESGEILPADLVVVGIGVKPTTDYVSGIAFQNDGSLKVDGHLAIHGKNAWAAGDIATYPDREGFVRIEHWKVAAQQGRVAGRNMAGNSQPYYMVPFFWSNQQGTNFRYVGHATNFDRIVFDGEPGDGPFLAFYIKDRHVQACLGVKRDAETAAIGELMTRGKMPSIDMLIDREWLTICRELR